MVKRRHILICTQILRLMSQIKLAVSWAKNTSLIQDVFCDSSCLSVGQMMTKISGMVTDICTYLLVTELVNPHDLLLTHTIY